jgi:methylase of polypeptide subunit release factors
LLAEFAVRDSRDRVFDPACGDGRLLTAALEKKLRLASARVSRERLAADLFGIDRSMDAVAAASRIAGSTAAIDFFEVKPGDPFPARFDAIIGNPPYIRQEFIGARDKRRVAELISNCRNAADGVFWPEFSGRSDIYVFFFAHAINFLREGGRLVFLTSTSWLDSGYGAPLREFLLKNFRIIGILESAVESFFEDASVNTLITILERCSNEHRRRDNRVTFAQLLEPIQDDTSQIAELIENAGRSMTAEGLRLRSVNQRELSSDEGWGKYLRAAPVFFQILERGAGLKRLGDLARVRFGVKTGANEFFYLEKNSREERGPQLKALSEVATVRRGLTTGANEFFYLRQANDKHRNGSPTLAVLDSAGREHLIEQRFLSPVLFSLKELPGIELNSAPGGKLFFNCHSAPAELEGTHAYEYIQQGEISGYHLRPSCSTRRPWYSVARGMKPAPLLFPSKVGERWLIALNRARVFEDKKLYGIFPAEGVNPTTLAALLNSTWVRYYTEVTCRQMTGAQAIADIDVTVAEQVLIPDPRSLPAALEFELGDALSAIAKRRTRSVFEEVKLEDRRRLDDLALQAMGFNGQRDRKRLLEQLYISVLELVRRRVEK